MSKHRITLDEQARACVGERRYVMRCEHCLELYLAQRRRAVWCSDACKAAARRASKPGNQPAETAP